MDTSAAVIGQAVKFEVVLLPDGRVNINGPIANKLLCYGLLEIARDLVKDYDPQKVDITPVRMFFPNGQG